MSDLTFPTDFLWGVATSAQQIEGHGAGSIWDRFPAEDGSLPHPACDHLRRWRDDIALLRWLGVDSYRFSTSWARIVHDPAGLDFYDALVDGLLDAGIEPFVTLNHWDLPQSLQDRGGWAERATVEAFVDLAGTVTARLGDRVRRWMTHNEPWCIATLGHEQGCHAPGRRDPREALRVAHHLLLSHGEAVGVIRGVVPQAEVGIVLNLSPGVPATDTDADRDAARRFDGFFNRWYLDPLLRGSYPRDAIADRVVSGHLDGADLPFVLDDDLERIATPLDFLGINYYSRTVIAADADGAPRAVPAAAADRLTEMGWEIYPDGLVDVLQRVVDDYDVPALWITENGAAFVDPPPQDGRIADPRRVAYLRDHVAAIARALARGLPVRGYFLWTLLDNWEWGHGYTKTFGLYDRERTPKDSAFWYRDLIATARRMESPCNT